MTMKTPFFGLVLLLAVALVCCSKNTAMSSDEMANQLSQVETALRQAHSWHISSSFVADGRQTSHIEEDIGCPYDYHRVGKVLDGRTMPEEIIATQSGLFYREHNLWSVSHQPPNDYCANGPAAAFSPLAQTLEGMKKSTTMKKGEIQIIDGASCRDFDFIGIANPHPKWGSLCIDEETNLPYEYRYGNNVFRYSKWNELVTLEPPPVS
jgi:hypothetical protein